jgi:hypothetical protein
MQGRNTTKNLSRPVTGIDLRRGAVSGPKWRENLRFSDLGHSQRGTLCISPVGQESQNIERRQLLQR